MLWLALSFLVSTTDAHEKIEARLASLDAPLADLASVTPHPEGELVAIARDQNEHAFIRQRAVAALAQFVTPEIGVELARLCAASQIAVRTTAAYVLGRYFSSTMADQVFAALRPLLADHNLDVRTQAARAMSFVHTTDAVAALTQRLSFESDPDFREFIFHRARQLQALLTRAP
jgi:HEAT repeat protein